MNAQADVALQGGGVRNELGWLALARHSLVLACITRYPGRDTNDIAKRVGLRKQTVTEVVAELIEAGRVLVRSAGRKKLYHRRPAGYISG